jgi:hypothetical protein
MVAAQVDAEGQTSSGWAQYGEVFLSSEIQDLICARLGGGGPGCESLPPEGGAADQDDWSGNLSLDLSAKVDGDLACVPQEGDAAGTVVGPKLNVSWAICCMDGATFSVAVAEDAPVVELKHAIGALRQLPCFTMELFVKDVEEPLVDTRPLRSLDRAPLFLLLKPASDRLALEALFRSCGGVGWRHKERWATDAELGKWYGVTVDDEDRVVKLELTRNGLAGPFPSEVQQLSALRVLNLGSNQLAGQIPAELEKLTALRVLQLARNELTGPIPAEVGQLPELTELNLSANRLTGKEALREYMEEHNADCSVCVVQQ